MQTPKLRIATLDDIPMLIFMGFQFRAETPYRDMQASTQSAADWCRLMISTGVIIIADEDSFLAAGTVQFPGTTNLVASEVMWGSTKHGLQRAQTEKLLLEAFEYWARNVAQADTVQIGSFHGDRALQKRGYRRCETLYLKAL